MSSSSKDSGYVDNWQAGKTVTECNLHMLTSEDCSDVIFRVGPEKHVVRAHRYVLISRSCVFYAMFCGPLAEKGEITIPDINFKDFSDFLRFVYVGDVDITSENVTGLLYTSRKYAVDALFNECASFLKKSLTGENACQVLEHCHGYGEMDLEQKALKILTEAGKKVIKSPGFLDLCSGCFRKFLKSEELTAKEEDIFEATVCWAKKQCQKENFSPTPENLRNVLSDMIYEIRFSCMAHDYLAKVVRPTKILTAEERIGILDKTFDSTVDITPFNPNPRKRSDTGKVKVVNRFGSVASGWGCSWGIQNTISFSANKDILLLGCQMYGSCASKESTYELNIILYDDQDQVIAEPVPISQRNLKGMEDVNDIMFPNPIPIVAGRTCTLYTTITGANSMYGKDGKSLVKIDGVEFTFKDSSWSSSVFTTTLRGQIPGLIWR